VIAICFAIFGDAAFHLIHLFEATLFHHGAQDFAADAASAVGDNGFVFDGIIFITVQLADEVLAGRGIGHNGVFELADGRFVGIAAVKKDYIVATLGNQLMHFSGFEVLATAYHTLLVNF